MEPTCFHKGITPVQEESKVVKGANAQFKFLSSQQAEIDRKVEEVSAKVDAIYQSTAKALPELNFKKGVALENERIKQRREELLRDIDITIKELADLNLKSEEFKAALSNLKFKDIQDVNGTQQVIYPKKEFQSKLKEYIETLSFALTMPINLQDRVRKELKILNAFEQTLPEDQLKYRNELTEKINNAHLTANKLNIIRAKYLEPAVSILPELRSLSEEISNLFKEVDQRKDEYQLQALKSSTDWEQIKEYLKRKQKTFISLSKQATEYEQIVKALHPKLKPITLEETKNSNALFFSHTPAIKSENEKAWEAMLYEANTDIERLKSSLFTQWNNIYNTFNDTAIQIDHIGYAVDEKGFMAKSSITSSFAVWSKRTLGKFAKTDITPIE